MEFGWNNYSVFGIIQTRFLAKTEILSKLSFIFENLEFRVSESKISKPWIVIQWSRLGGSMGPNTQ